MKGIFKKLKSNKGFTLMELVVALSVIIVITVSGISAIKLGIEISSNNGRYLDVRVLGNNVLEYYKYVDSCTFSEDSTENVNSKNGLMNAFLVNHGFKAENSIYKITNYSYVIEVSYSFSDLDAKIKISALKMRNEKQAGYLFNFTYSKGD